MKRRQFITGAASTLAGMALLPTRRASALSVSGRTLVKMPPLIDATASRSFELTAMRGQTDFGLGTKSPTMGYNQPYLGPVLRLANGTTRAKLTNQCDIDVSAHWHGLILPGESDGGPHQPVAPGGVWEPELAINQSPTTAWFHSHIHGETALSVYAGLAGGIIISDGRDDERGLPSTYGVDDLYLVLQDKAFSDSGKLAYSNAMMTRMHGFSGGTMVVNGQVDGVAAVPNGLVRLRLLNGSNARFYALAMEDGRPLHLIASDGGFLPKPLAAPFLRLAPGERAEVLVDFSDGNPVALMSRNDVNASAFNADGTLRPDPDAFEVLAFAPDGDKARIMSVPDVLDGTVPDLTGKPIATERSFDLTLGMMGGMMRRGNFASINGEPYDMRRINFDAKLGTVEKWTIRSQMMPHPFHVHGTAFQVLTENGKPPRPENRGWKDTVVVDMEMEILVPFDQPAPASAPFMYHCHILEHEDGGMMGQFTVS